MTFALWRRPRLIMDFDTLSCQGQEKTQARAPEAGCEDFPVFYGEGLDESS